MRNGAVVAVHDEPLRGKETADFLFGVLTQELTPFELEDRQKPLSILPDERFRFIEAAKAFGKLSEIHYFLQQKMKVTNCSVQAANFAIAAGSWGELVSLHSLC